MGHQQVEDGCWVTVTLGYDIVVSTPENDFRVPTKELKAFLVVIAADGIPVVIIPVAIAGILVKNHVVDEVVLVEQCVQFLVGSFRRQ